MTGFFRGGACLTYYEQESERREDQHRRRLDGKSTPMPCASARGKLVNC
jgi:hypothetical protein